MKEEFCTCSSTFLKTNKIDPHWRWTQRRSSRGVNFVIICCLSISWFAYCLFVYVIDLSILNLSFISFLWDLTYKFHMQFIWLKRSWNFQIIGVTWLENTLERLNIEQHNIYLPKGTINLDYGDNTKYHKIWHALKAINLSQ